MTTCFPLLSCTVPIAATVLYKGIVYLQNHYAHSWSREKISTEDWKVILGPGTDRHIQHLHTSELPQLQPEGPTRLQLDCDIKI